MTAAPPGSAAEALARAAHALLREVGAPERFLAGWPQDVVPRPLAPRSRPALAWLPAVVEGAVPGTATLVHALAAAAASLRWEQSYTPAAFGPAFLDRYAWTEAIGQRGPVASSTVACGFLMLGPDTHYPPHAHEAEELYLPLSGTALWRRGDEPEVSRAPGKPILHPSRAPHAMRTGDEPLLALYVWRGGDLGATPSIIG